MSFRFDVEHNGVTLNQGIRFDMANSTFSLSSPSASPPTFESSQSVYAQYESAGGGYQIRVVGTWLTGTAASANQPPIAYFGDDVNVNCTSEIGAELTLDGTASSDPNGDELTYEWSVPSGVVLDDPTSPTPTATFPIGITTATSTVTDGNGGLDVDDVVITVVDQTPPEVAATTDIGAIWPPNHEMVPVVVAIFATDHCTAPESLILGSVTIQSSEPDDAEGDCDGDTTGDVDGQDGFTGPVDVTNFLTYDPDTASFVGIVWLRAERDSEGPGRSYGTTLTP